MLNPEIVIIGIANPTSPFTIPAPAAMAHANTISFGVRIENRDVMAA
jgi:hypothetical protein